MATRIPINKDQFGFEDKQDDIWTRMEQDMERRRREWQSEIDNMSKDFFHMRTDKDSRFGTIPSKMSIPGGHADGKAVIEKDQHGNPVFRASFNVDEFKPEEVNVKMDAHKITVVAKHEEKCGGKSVSREYSRELHIPKEIDPMAIQCKIDNDGILSVEAPFPVPDYDTGMSQSLSKPSATTASIISAPSFQGKSLTGTQSILSSGQPASKQTLSESQYSMPGSGMSQSLSKPSTTTGSIISAPSFQGKSLTGIQSILSSGQPSSKQTLTESQYSMPGSKANTVSFSSSPPPPPPSYPPPPSSAASHHISTATHFTSGPNSSPAFQPAPPYSATKTTSSLSGAASPITILNDKMFKIEIDIEDFCPEELTVKTQDNKLNINARREIVTGNRKSTKEINREFIIPNNVNPMMVKAFFTDGGKLVVEAPFLNMADGSGSTLAGR